MMLLYYAVFLFYCIFNVSTQELNDTVDEGVSNKNLNGWNFHVEVDPETGNVDISYSCTEYIEGSSVTWNSSALVDNTQSVTIENCNLDVTIESEDDLRTNNSTMAELMVLEHFSRLKIRNIKSLRVGPLLSGLLLTMKGKLMISIEDVQSISLLPNEFLSCLSFSKEDMMSQMESLNFEMTNVTVKSVDKNAILCNDTSVPMTVTWNNVTVEKISSEAISMFGYDNETTNLADEELILQDNKVLIINSTFEDLPSNVIKGAINDFQFINNSVQLVQNCFIDITSTNIIISNNEFNHLKNFSFSCISRGENGTLHFNSNKINASEEFSMHFGTYVSDDMEETTSIFHNNTFKCLNSAWIKRSNKMSETNYLIKDGVIVNYTDIETYENFLYENTDNVCSDEEIECTKTIKNFHHDYPVFHELWQNYCSKEFDNTFFIVSLLVILAIGIVISIFVYHYTEGNFTPRCIDSSREYEVYLAEQQRPTYDVEELAEPIEIELKNDDEIKIKTSR